MTKSLNLIVPNKTSPSPQKKNKGIFGIIFFLGEGIFQRGCFVWDFWGEFFFLGEGMFCLGILISERVKDWGRWSVFQVGRKGREI